MNRMQKILLAVLLAAVVIVIIMTWGSIGSAVLTLALLLSLGFMLIKFIMEKRDESDFDWEG